MPLIISILRQVKYREINKQAQASFFLKHAIVAETRHINQSQTYNINEFI